MNSNNKKSKGGRPLKLSVRDKKFCVQQIAFGNKENAIEVKESLQNDLDMSTRTVCRVLWSCFSIICQAKESKSFSKKYQSAFGMGKSTCTLDYWGLGACNLDRWNQNWTIWIKL